MTEETKPRELVRVSLTLPDGSMISWTKDVDAISDAGPTETGQFFVAAEDGAIIAAFSAVGWLNAEFEYAS